MSRPPRVSIAGEGHEQPADHRRHHHQDGDSHGDDALELADPHGLHHVEGDGSVLELFDEVPGQEGSSLLGHLPLGQLVVFEGVLCDHGGEVLDRSRDGHLGAGGEALSEVEGDLARPVDPGGRVAQPVPAHG